MRFREIKHRGQVMVLWALLTPVLICFLGAGMDLGWYYLNVSRLQNAADAAALAGARAVTESLQNQYYVLLLTGNELPADKLEYEKIHSQNFGVLNSHKSKTEIETAIKDGTLVAEEYTRLNLSDAITTATSKKLKEFSATDGWSVSPDSKDRTVSGTVNLYAKTMDIRNDDLGAMYYVVELKENIRHFFLPGWFSDMFAPVKSVVLLNPHKTDLYTMMKYLESTMVIGNWEYQNHYKDKTGSFYSGKWNLYLDSRVHYAFGDAYRTESTSIKTNNASGTTANNPAGKDGFKYDAGEVDSLNIDFRAEEWKAVTSTTKDFDILQASEVQQFDFQDSWSRNVATTYRILFTANFDEPFTTRYPNDSKPDPLWIRVESEPIISLKYIGKSGHTAYNSVRQITLNINSDNTASSHRPLFIFYLGPEKLNSADVDSNGNHVRDSQPVVINLNTNFNGVLFMPDSPVIIRGNDNTWKGFIIAKEFLAAMTPEDFIGIGYKKVTDYYSDNNDLLVKPALLKSLRDLDIEDGGYVNAVDAQGNIQRFPTDTTHYALLTKVGSTAKYFVDTSLLKDEQTTTENTAVMYKGLTKYVAASNLITYYTDKVKYNAKDYLEVTAAGETFLVFVKDIEKTFRRVKDGDEDKYLDEDNDYYQIVWQTFNKRKVNPTVHDKNGNIQTKALSSASTYKNDQNHPNHDEWNIEVDGEEYRVYTSTEKIEVGYYRDAFGLNGNSWYSSFQVSVLKRSNYVYLDKGDSSDMFFTTRRAKWVD